MQITDFQFFRSKKFIKFVRYMLPEAEQTYLKHPIAPNPPQPAQFHTPHGPVIKIRKSRYSMLKTGMQRLSLFF